MDKQPKISIIIPIYNAEKYIDRCMASVYAQTMKDYEIILVNDGSTDNSAAICRRYAAQDDRITYIEKENGGAGSARNKGIEAARGEYLAFPDADDWFEPELYEALTAAAQDGCDMVFSGVNYYQQTENGVVYSRTQNIEAVSLYDKQSCREHIMTFFPTTTIFDVPWNKLYKRRIVTENKIRFTDIRRCQDAMFNLDFFNCIDSAVSLDKAYYNYMENTVDDVRRKFPKNYIDINIIYYTHLIGILTQWGVYTGDIKRHYDTSFVLSVYHSMERFDNPLWELDKTQQEQYVRDILERGDVQERLREADVRDDAQQMFDIIRNKDYDAFMKQQKKERRKEKLRSSRLVMGAYRTVKKIKGQ